LLTSLQQWSYPSYTSTSPMSNCWRSDTSGDCIHCFSCIDNKHYRKVMSATQVFVDVCSLVASKLVFISTASKFNQPTSHSRIDFLELSTVSKFQSLSQ
jgi:hypothetical protein